MLGIQKINEIDGGQISYTYVCFPHAFIYLSPSKIAQIWGINFLQFNAIYREYQE